MASSKSKQKFPLVGIGASAGGIDSFKRFLGAVPENSGMAYILVQHLSPTHESALTEILARTTKLPVQEIADNCEIRPNSIYVIPENKILEITDHSLKLTPRRQQGQHLPIDIFFCSLAISEYTPASVIVDEHLEIVHINGNIEPFVGSSQGRPTHELLKMARKELAFELRSSIHKAKESQLKIVKKGIPVRTEWEQFAVDLEIVPMHSTINPFYLILFWKRSAKRSFFEKIWAKLEPSLNTSKESEAQRRNNILERDLEQLREDMRNISEEQEAYNEELQSANEELLSSNEEMQSLNEELETSKEELQSTNEELVVMNRELLEKQEELNDALNFADNIISTVREPFLVLDKNLFVQKANTSFYTKFNLSEKEIGGKYFFDIQDGFWNNEALHSMLKKILPEKKQVQNEEIKLNFSAGEERIFLFNARVIEQRSISSSQLILLEISDITDRKAIEENYLTTIEELNNINEQLDQFVHVASHDLQEPLRKITTFANVITQKDGDISKKDMGKYLGKITSSASRMSALIKNMLNYARLAHHEIDFEQTDLNEILGNVLTDFELLIEQKGAEINIAHLPTIEAIPLQIDQLFYNLISNALKFTREDIAPVVSISVHRLSEKEIKEHLELKTNLPHYELIVRDNGIGFGAKYQEQIFTIFQRLNPSSQYLGTGIGLALCKKIVENHHGIIYAHSKEGQGSAFHILLPMAQPK